MFKINNKKTPERRHCRRSRVFIVNFKHISHLFLVFLLLTLNRLMLAEYSTVIFKIEENKNISFGVYISFKDIMFLSVI